MEENKVYDASSDESFEDRLKVEKIRNDSKLITVNGKKIGRIEKYKFKILVRDKDPIEGEFSREEMNLIYRLYSSEGTGLTQREVSKHFGEYTFQQFKKILRAFNITKHGSAPLAPHVIEERSPEELVELAYQNKENDFLRKVEQDRVKVSEKKYTEILQKHYNLTETLKDFRTFLPENLGEVQPFEFKKPSYSGTKTFILHLSDIHLGADVSRYALYENKYTFSAIKKRMEQLIQQVLNVCSEFKIDNLIVTNLGDSIDGYNKQTTRGGHTLPQNMENKDQFRNFVVLMVEMFNTFSKSGLFNYIKYYAVDGGNHDGDIGFMVNKALEASLYILNPKIKVRVFEKTIDHFKVNNHTYILSHGKDADDMFRNMPLTLNDKWENQINDYINYHELNGNISFVKGDLHNSATTYGKRFRYKSVASFFGSSKWIQANFGNTKAAVDYEIVTKDNIFESRIILN